MKKSSLKSFIREEIISILKEASTALVTSKGGTKPVSFSNPAELNQLKSDSNVTSITTTAGQKIKEIKRIPTSVKDKAKDALNMHLKFAEDDDEKEYIFSVMSRIDKATKYQELVDILGNFGYNDDDIEEIIGVSPGMNDIDETAANKNIKISAKKGYNMNEEMEKNKQYYKNIAYLNKKGLAKHQFSDKDIETAKKMLSQGYFKLDDNTKTIDQKIKEAKKEIKVGDEVTPKVGPHKGVKHKVIHVFNDDTFNIQPILKPDQKNMYRLGAVKTSLKDVELVSEAKTESDYFEREPKAKDIEKGEGIIAKTKKLMQYQQELKQLTTDMQDLAAEYKEAEGSDKEDILRTLKVKTAAKKELEKKITQLEKYV